MFDIKSKQFILEPKFDDIYTFNDNLLQVFLQGKQGIFDIKNHRFILDPKFDKIDGCDNNTQRISLNGKYGVINENAQLIVPIKFDYISPCFSNNLGFASDKNKVGYINKKGSLLSRLNLRQSLLLSMVLRKSNLIKIKNLDLLIQRVI
ncbi:WG repeat-containing protein [Campylobacter lari]|uniref:WG repeat-containing protein n=1 Tax=Campylobacter lari TaxID=201 RepID=UPI0021520F49|nr:WG repeat-containing protein [Campylobacter lari]MCR6538493.1 WG repeat-containing protein [Campylobacter lari]